MKSGCCELPNRPEQVGVEGFPAAGEHSFDSPFSAAVVPRNNRQPTPRGPGSVRGKVAHGDDSDIDNDARTMWQQAAVWEVTEG